ncbi:MAG: AmpG family muropeptide MFS transporter [Xanthomonadales bacterium]|nr:AmpG family muropeptide MFS transporter [Xanthomonadales bacterium]
MTKTKKRSPWLWIPSLYFAEGLPYVVVMTVSVIMYKGMGVSNTEIALYTSWLYLPWVIKPLWSPLVDILKTRRSWIVAMQLLVGAGLAGVALTLPGDNFLRWSLAFLWLLAFSSATHDIAADGFYMLGLSQHQQAWFVGVRSTFYRLAMITGQGLLVMLAGAIEQSTGSVTVAWTNTFYVLAGLFLLFCLYHQLVLPRPESDRSGRYSGVTDIFREFARTFVSFFRKEHIGVALAFLLLFRFAEAQLAKMAAPFLLDSAEVGGLALSTTQVGFVYGTVGVLMLTIGGILGGFLAARNGLKFWLWWMVAAINLPNAVYIFLSLAQPEAYWIINAAVAVEQFGYGFGFTAYMLYMIYLSQGEHETAHFAICTGFMALGMMVPGMLSGWLQEWMGYQNFFVWVMLATVPSFVVAWLIPIRPDFGRREAPGKVA